VALSLKPSLRTSFTTVSQYRATGLQSGILLPFYRQPGQIVPSDEVQHYQRCESPKRHWHARQMISVQRPAVYRGPSWSWRHEHRRIIFHPCCPWRSPLYQSTTTSAF